MGFTTGFTGGVTLTLSLAYLGALAHQRNRERQAAVLRQQTLLLTALHDPLPPKLPPLTRAERAAAERRGLVDAAKDRWNAEVEHAARWAQTKDWEEVRDNLEDAVAGLWARAFGGGGGGDGAAAAASASKAIVGKGGKEEAKKSVGEVSKKVDQVAADAKSSAGGVFSALSKGFERGKDAISSFGRAKVDAEVKAEEKSEGLSPEERALKQRYRKSGSGDDRSVEEILAERYLPTDKKKGL